VQLDGKSVDEVLYFISGEKNTTNRSKSRPLNPIISQNLRGARERG